MGVEAILRQDPHTRPSQTIEVAGPRLPCGEQEARKRFWEAHSAFVAAFRGAAEKLKAGEWP